MSMAMSCETSGCLGGRSSASHHESSWRNMIMASHVLEVGIYFLFLSSFINSSGDGYLAKMLRKIGDFLKGKNILPPPSTRVRGIGRHGCVQHGFPLQPYRGGQGELPALRARAGQRRLAQRAVALVAAARNGNPGRCAHRVAGGGTGAPHRGAVVERPQRGGRLSRQCEAGPARDPLGACLSGRRQVQRGVGARPARTDWHHPGALRVDICSSLQNAELKRTIGVSKFLTPTRIGRRVSFGGCSCKSAST